MAVSRLYKYPFWWEVSAAVDGTFEVILRGSKGSFMKDMCSKQAGHSEDMRTGVHGLIQWSKFQENPAGVLFMDGGLRNVKWCDLGDPSEDLHLLITCNGATDRFTLKWDGSRISISISDCMRVVNCSVEASETGLIASCTGLSGDELCSISMGLTATAGDLRKMVSKHVSQAAASVKLVAKDAVLDDGVSLSQILHSDDCTLNSGRWI